MSQCSVNLILWTIVLDERANHSTSGSRRSALDILFATPSPHIQKPRCARPFVDRLPIAAAARVPQTADCTSRTLYVLCPRKPERIKRQIFQIFWFLHFAFLPLSAYLDQPLFVVWPLLGFFSSFALVLDSFYLSRGYICFACGFTHPVEGTADLISETLFPT